MRDAFLSYVEERTVENSCIFHGTNGCSLPRDARSTVCNAFECANIRQMLNRLARLQPQAVFLAAMEKNTVIRIAFVDPSGETIAPKDP